MFLDFLFVCTIVLALIIAYQLLDVRPGRRQSLVHRARASFPHLITERRGVYYPRSKTDIFQVAFILRQVLVADLVPQILDQAEYWTRSRHDRREEISVFERDAGRVYLATSPIESPLRNPVRRICFVIYSKDQGTSWDRDYHGTYLNSWTWFCVDKVASSQLPSLPGEYEKQEEEPPFRLLSNLHAGKHYMTHGIDWTLDSSDENARRFLRSIQHGDRIRLGVWARYRGWINWVGGARMDVYTACVR